VQFRMISLIVHSRNFELKVFALSLRISIEASAETRVDWTNWVFLPVKAFPALSAALGGVLKIGDIVEVFQRVSYFRNARINDHVAIAI
jgi:hypothetical protein